MLVGCAINQRFLTTILVSVVLLSILSTGSAHAQPCTDLLFSGWLFEVGDSPHSFSPGDLDGDGDLDMAVTNYGGNNVSVLLNLCIQPSACPADMNLDGELNIFDVLAYVEALSQNDPVADFTGDGIVNIFDLFVFIEAFNAGYP